MNDYLEQYSMPALCEALRVSRSGFYAWRKRPKQVNELNEAVSQIHQTHKRKIGAPYIQRELASKGLTVSERTVGRRMNQLEIRAELTRRYRHTTQSNHNALVSENLLNRQFTVGKPNQVWVGDITYLQTTDGWLYLAVMIDLFSRQVVGWQMSSRIDQVLVNDALQAALLSRGNPRDVMIHTDRGSQYCACSFRKIIADHHLIQSMSRKGNCWDNAVSESFFASLKKQCIQNEMLISSRQMRNNIFEYIELYYNSVRRHSSNNWLSPMEFERLYQQR
jgi:transposase InsO family protein